MNSIRKEIENRGIINLVHFTHWRNLKGIYTLKKIISRKKLLKERLIDREDILFKHNDNFRMEGEQYINLSITHINRNLFKAFRSRSQNNASINWCVIKLDKQLLSDTSLKCLFSVTNAASATAKKYGIGTDLINFQNMFLNEINITNTFNSGTIYRKSQKDNETTDNQAEVLVLGDIPINYIKKVCFESEEDLMTIQTTFDYYGLSSDKFIVDKSIFL
ncbi:MAG: DUF4433 domain-containing protein [Gammaproteobacteria bacterium]|nr:DUF4433 domain-containing protein [Gammaproteobacteria bacterium]